MFPVQSHERNTFPLSKPDVDGVRPAQTVAERNPYHTLGSFGPDYDHAIWKCEERRQVASKHVRISSSSRESCGHLDGKKRRMYELAPIDKTLAQEPERLDVAKFAYSCRGNSYGCVDDVAQSSLDRASRRAEVALARRQRTLPRSSIAASNSFTASTPGPTRTSSGAILATGRPRRSMTVSRPSRSASVMSSGR